MTRTRRILFAAAALCALALVAGAALGQAEAPAGPSAMNVDLSNVLSKSNFSDLAKITIVLSVLTLVPAVLLTMTAFTRIVIVLSFVRRALTVQSMPPNQTLIGLSLFLTVFVMAPVFKKINAEAVQPNLRGEISEMDAIRRAEGPLRDFMLRQTRKKDLMLFVKLAQIESPRTVADIPTYIVVPAFALSEIKTSFQMGFVVFLPMLVVDIVVATLLTSMGMFMLPPNMVSVPLKILLFVLVDGWHLVIGSLAKSFM